MAKLFSGNLTHISPVWYHLKSDGNRLILEGEHNFDAAWVSELQSNGSLALQLVKQLGEALHPISSESSNRHLELIYVIPAPRMQELNNQDFRSEELQLADSLDGFSLMTYDFSGPRSPGPSAPLKWVQHSLTTLLAAKGSSRSHSWMIFLGINFYGNDFLLSRDSGGGSITGRDFVRLLEKYKPSL